MDSNKDKENRLESGRSRGGGCGVPWAVTSSISNASLECQHKFRSKIKDGFEADSLEDASNAALFRHEADEYYGIDEAPDCSNTGAQSRKRGKYTVVSSGIDSLYLTIQLSENSHGDLFASISENTDSKLGIVDIWNHKWRLMKVSVKESGGYRLGLDDGYIRVLLAEKWNENMPCIKLGISSDLLHTYSLKECWHIVKRMFQGFSVISVLINRVDLYVDVAGLSLEEMKRENRVCYSGKYAMYEDSGKITGHSYGARGGDIYCRIYDKLKEINDISHKSWMFGIWSNNGWNGEEVTRVEFELRRGFFRDIEYGTIDDLFLLNLSDVWVTCTKWLSFREDGAIRLKDREVTEYWKFVVGSWGKGVKLKRKRRSGDIRERVKNADRRLLAAIADSSGYRQESISETFERVLSYMRMPSVRIAFSKRQWQRWGEREVIDSSNKHYQLIPF